MSRLHFRQYVALLSLLASLIFHVAATKVGAGSTATFPTPHSSTVVCGQFANGHLYLQAEIQVNQKYLDGKSATFKTNIADNGSFHLEATIAEPQFVTFVLGRNKTTLYLEPGDSLHLGGNADAFPNDLTFSGPGGANNSFLSGWFAANPNYFNPFNLVQYKKGEQWFGIDRQLDSLMQMTEQAGFRSAMQARKDWALGALHSFAANRPGELTVDFQEFFTAESVFDWAYSMLIYYDVFRYTHNVDSSFCDFLLETPFSCEKIGSPAYRQFLLAFCNHEAMKSKTTENTFATQYTLAAGFLKNKTLNFCRSEILGAAFKAKNALDVLPQYQDFLSTNGHPGLADKVIAGFEKSLKYAPGTPAPDFELKDADGKPVALRHFRGKVVYLNFWASWCAPCMRKMAELQNLQNELAGKGVIFVHVSLDREESAWKNLLQQTAWNGVHVFAPGGVDASPVAKSFEVRALPQYFLLNKNGLFEPKAAGTEFWEVRNHLLKIAGEMR